MIKQRDDDAAWKALADGTRRRLLDLLSDAPQTTGALCASIPSLGRTTVMKHLDVLSSAGLLLIRREGRTRWNHLNPVPIQEIYERWIHRRSGLRANAMLGLREAAERLAHERRTDETDPDHEDASMNADAATPTPHDVTVERIALSLPIAAPPATVWEAMTRDIGLWWPSDYRGTADAKGFHFEAHPGGRVWEETDSGGLVWFTVQALEVEKWVNLAGFTGPPWGGPSVTTMRIELHEEDSGHTRLEVTDASFGRVAGRAEVTAGWQAIFGGLQARLADQAS